MRTRVNVAAAIAVLTMLGDGAQRSSRGAARCTRSAIQTSSARAAPPTADTRSPDSSLEYDTMSGRYAEFVETEVLPRVEQQFTVRLTRDPEARATMGCSSGGAAALAMAWYRTDLYHRVLIYSGTFVNQQWPSNHETPHGAWEFHENLIPKSPVKPLRIWMHVGDRDLLNTLMHHDTHDWVVANERMARVLSEKGYEYQFVFARNSGHCDRAVKAQTLPSALEWLWHGYPKEPAGVAPQPDHCGQSFRRMVARGAAADAPQSTRRDRARKLNP